MKTRDKQHSGFDTKHHTARLKQLQEQGGFTAAQAEYVAHLWDEIRVTHNRIDSLDKKLNYHLHNCPCPQTCPCSKNAAPSDDLTKDMNALTPVEQA